MDLLGACLVVLLVAGFVWLVWAADRARAKQDRQDMEEIKKFPLDVQVRLLAAKLRHDADRDWW